jgi:hypothetical protein
VVLLFPVIVTVVTLVTVLVVTVNEALVLPAATVMLDGTVATDLLLVDKLTTAPPVGAGPFKMTVPVDGTVPWTVVGFKVSELSDGVDTVSVVERLFTYTPVIPTLTLLETGVVVIVKFAVVAFA